MEPIEGNEDTLKHTTLGGHYCWGKDYERAKDGGLMYRNAKLM
jgi:hypothetical protein